MARQTTKRAVATARKLRANMSLPEVLLWRELREAPLKFRRQHPLGPYVLDFYCASARLGVEVDGIGHDMGDRPKQDEAREAWITAQGITVIRIAATEVLQSPPDTAEAILAACRARTP